MAAAGGDGSDADGAGNVAGDCDVTLQALFDDDCEYHILMMVVGGNDGIIYSADNVSGAGDVYVEALVNDGCGGR